MESPDADGDIEITQPPAEKTGSLFVSYEEARKKIADGITGDVANRQGGATTTWTN